MLVLIDESGCPGFKLNKGSTSNFVVAMTIFNDFSIAEQASFAIAKLREKLKVKPEFKFNKSCNSVRDVFFDTILAYDFSVRALVVDKQEVYSSYLRQNKESFYNFFVRSLITRDGNCLNNAIVKIDGSGGKVFRRAMLTYFRSQVGKEKVKDYKIVDSRKDNLIQLADMTVGAIARSYNDDRKNNKRWLKKLRSAGKIGDDDIWLFHKKGASML